MRPPTATRAVSLLLSANLCLTGCGSGSSGSTGASAPAVPPPLVILGLPASPSRVAAMALRVETGTASEIRWTLDRRDGAGPRTVGTGSTLDLAVPEGELVIAALASHADGSQRSGSAVLVIDRSPPLVRLRGLRIAGSVSAGATVTVAGVVDGDGRADASFSVEMACDGGSAPASLPIDRGAAIGYDLSIAVDGLIHPMRLEEIP